VVDADGEVTQWTFCGQDSAPFIEILRVVSDTWFLAASVGLCHSFWRWRASTAGCDQEE